MRTIAIKLSLLTLVLFAGCKSIESDVYRDGIVTESGEPAYITVQHCLIAFSGTGTGATRSKEAAEQLALELFDKAKNGDDFAAIVSKYTDDSAPGIYKMANRGFPGDNSSRIPTRNVFTRDGMVPAFGDTGFPLEVGEYGLAVFDEEKSPYGWHIVKRID